MNYILKDSSGNFVNRIVWDGIAEYPIPNGWTLIVDTL